MNEDCGGFSRWKQPIKKWSEPVSRSRAWDLVCETLARKKFPQRWAYTSSTGPNFISVEISWLGLVNQRCPYLNWETHTLNFSLSIEAGNKERDVWYASLRLSPCRVQGSCDDVMTVLKSTSICFKVFWFFMVALRERTLWLQLY